MRETGGQEGAWGRAFAVGELLGGKAAASGAKAELKGCLWGPNRTF